MDFWIKAAQLILSLSILIVLHEFGHFIPARIFKTRVEKFYLFFNWKFSLIKKKIGETEWGIGWIPLGGYVKIAGMIDESMDKEQMAKPAQPWEFRAKPAWQRLIIMCGGVIVNFIVAFFIYAMLIWVNGVEYSTPKTATYGMHVVNEKLYDYGLEEGDVPIKVGDQKVSRLNDVFQGIVIDGNREMTVRRNNKEVKITFPQDFDQVVLREKISGFYELRFPNVVDEVVEKSNAQKAGLKENDSIVSINGKEVPFFDDFRKELKENSSKKIELGIYRNGQEMTLPVEVTDKGTIGYAPATPDRFLPFEKKQYGFFESFPAGFSYGTKILGTYVKSIGLIFTKEGASQVGGFGSMGKIFPSEWNWTIFWTNTALISIILAFMNILPIPALDGGHVMFLLYEIITGKEAPQKVLEYAQYIGFFLILGLVLYANGNDIFKWFTGG